MSSNDRKCTGAISKFRHKVESSDTQVAGASSTSSCVAVAETSNERKSTGAMAKTRKGGFDEFGFWDADQIEPPEFKSTDDIILGQEIGKALHGTVRVAKHRLSNSKLYAVKIYNINDLEGDYFPLAHKEVSNMKLLKHPNILPMTISLVSNYRIHIITPLMPGKSVSQLIQSKNREFQYGIPEVAIAMVVNDMLEALAYLHKRKLIHRAVKASHMLFSETGYVVLTGFRFMIEKPQSEPLHVNDLDLMGHNLHWLSPEILNQDYGGYGENSDLYSLGMAMLEMGNGIAALDTNTPSMMFLKKVGCRSPSLMDLNHSYEQEVHKYETVAMGGGDADNQGPQMKKRTTVADRRRDNAFKIKEYGRDIKDFLALCLVAEKRIRPDVETMRKHKFIKTYSRTPRVLLMSFIGDRGIEFESEYVFPTTPREVSKLSWDFEDINLKDD